MSREQVFCQFGFFWKPLSRSLRLESKKDRTCDRYSPGPLDSAVQLAVARGQLTRRSRRRIYGFLFSVPGCRVGWNRLCRALISRIAHAVAVPLGPSIARCSWRLPRATCSPQSKKNLRFPLLCSGVPDWVESFVPGVDFRAVRELISMAEVLELVGFEAPATVSGSLRGPCPIHRSHSVKSRSFAVNVPLKVYHCFTCGSAGNHLDLYAAFTRQSIYKAAIDLCEKLHRAVPWIQPKRPTQISPTSSS
jgi:hypothetical protein